jgi:ascorbate-specific PTS system EIIC-type component UlaA
MRVMDSEVPWYYRPWPVLLLLFLVLGPLGLPLLWRSPRFTRTWKIVLTGLVLVYTAMLVESVVVSVRLAMERLGMAAP